MPPGAFTACDPEPRDERAGDGCEVVHPAADVTPAVRRSLARARCELDHGESIVAAEPRPQDTSSAIEAPRRNDGSKSSDSWSSSAICSASAIISR